MRRVIALLFCAAAALSAAERVSGGPYVVSPTAKSAVIGWVVESDRVKTGAAPAELTHSVPLLHGESISMTGLKDGETIYYEIPGSASVEQRTGHFKVAPASAASFQFVVFGDTRTRDELHRKIIQAISKTDPDFVIHTGDLIANGNDSIQWRTFFDIEKDLLRKTVFFPVLGNHERNSARFYDLFAVAKPFYSFNWGSAHFTIIDSDLANISPSAAERDRFWTEQTRWLEDDLRENQKADFRFVVMHHPPLTAHQAENHESKITPGLIPLFEKYKVSTVFAGHDHNYQHHVKNGIHYVVTGGGGAPLATVESPIAGVTKIAVMTEHYVAVRVERNRARIDAIALDGHAIETINLNP